MASGFAAQACLLPPPCITVEARLAWELVHEMHAFHYIERIAVGARLAWALVPEITLAPDGNATVSKIMTEATTNTRKDDTP